MTKTPMIPPHSPEASLAVGGGHTPGPWAVTRKFEVGPTSTADDQSSGMVIPVADVYGDNRDADARLIAAAPEMFEALKAILEDHDNTYDGEPMHAERHLAIEAARDVLLKLSPSSQGEG